MYHLSPTMKPISLFNLLSYFQEDFPLIYDLLLMIVLNIPRAPRSKDSPRHKNISDSFPTLSINFASVHNLSTCVLYTLTSDRRDIAVEFFIFFYNFFIYVSIITDTNYLCIWGIRYCKMVFVIILSS